MRRVTLIGMTLATLLACRSGDRDQDTVAIQQQAVVQAAAGMVGRREPQMYLDSASQFLESSDTSAAARMFGLAAPILREHATLTASTERGSLQASAGELDSLAGMIRAGQIVTSHAYREVLIRLNLAEAEHHRSLATAALVAGDTMLAGEELVMSADHFDRALRDRGTVPSQIAALIDESLKLGTAMHRGEAFASQVVAARLNALERSIQSTRAGAEIIRK